MGLGVGSKQGAGRGRGRGTVPPPGVGLAPWAPWGGLTATLTGFPSAELG